MKDDSFSKIFLYKKYEDLFDFNSLECRLSVLFTVSTVILFKYIISNNDINTINQLLLTVSKDIALVNVSLLGLIITGLAILTGSISSKVVDKINSSKKMIYLEKILLSFYLIGLLSAFLIFYLFLMYLLINTGLNLNMVMLYFSVILVGYLFIFVVFYSVKLIGNCIEMFYIVNLSENKDNNKKVYSVDEFKSIYYNNIRITSLEKSLLASGNSELFNKYKESIKEQIECIEDENISNTLLKFYNTHFNEK